MPIKRPDDDAHFGNGRERGMMMSQPSSRCCPPRRNKNNHNDCESGTGLAQRHHGLRTTMHTSVCNRDGHNRHAERYHRWDNDTAPRQANGTYGCLENIVVSVECMMLSFTANALIHDLMPLTRIGARYLWTRYCLAKTKSTMSVLAAGVGRRVTCRGYHPNLPSRIIPTGYGT